MKKPIFAVMATASAVLMTASVALAEVECTIGNWSSTVGMTANTFSVGKPGNSNRRFAGPCGLRVNVDGTPRYLVDNSPSAETSYNARFYVFLNDVEGNVTLFRALDGSDSVFELEYIAASSQIRMILDGAVADTSAELESGWHAVAVSWSVQDAAEARLTVNGTAGDIKTPSNTARRIGSVQLGSIATSAGAAGTIDFDDFDSRRGSVPEGVCRGLTDLARSQLTFADAQEIFRDAVSANYTASGQPDFDGDGRVTFRDAQLVFARALSGSTRDCSVNRL